ncbi:hypothetical protein D8Y20_12525 [Mariprofundus sp. EBB-1]|nr:hypothetical protein D8Y20_12525 [Mariprofundus sp. EBB-1]
MFFILEGDLLIYALKTMLPVPVNGSVGLISLHAFIMQIKCLDSGGPNCSLGHQHLLWINIMTQASEMLRAITLFCQCFGFS